MVLLVRLAKVVDVGTEASGKNLKVERVDLPIAYLTPLPETLQWWVWANFSGICFRKGRNWVARPQISSDISSLLGDHGIVASRLGNDVLGEEARRRFQHLRSPTDSLQPTTHPTGTVRVSLDAGGQPKYEIAGPVAWDFFEMTSG